MKSDHPTHDEIRWMQRGLPTWPVLLSFVEVAASGSVTKTAERLNLTQSAVSHHIAQMERLVGERLFERSAKTMRPTAKAQTLARQLRDQLGMLSETIEAARPQAGRHDLHVVVAPEFFRYWLASRLDAFVASHGDVALRVSQDYRRDVFSDGDADLQIRLARPMAQEDGFTLLFDDEFVVCSPDLKRRLPARQAFSAAPFLSHSDAYHTSLDWRRWNSEFFGIEDGRWIEDRLADMVVLPSFEDMLAACRRGEGFALVRTMLVTDDIASGRLVKAVIESLPADNNYHLVHRSGVALRPAATMFVAWLREQVATPAAR
ncbi:LysR family transcriptional regulator [Rhizobium tumorigenes]|uniref:LysR family transcriptional regulator n=1 Tax=Rhizobium tumorigenes TaxID=2041385 RepID=UPI00241E30A8|nr:LysR family transcriptional regulator [Rhizobium tumorigenes]WFS03518.1 LysR family transcriptional regulator [Rhizobium tumorigenes]